MNRTRLSCATLAGAAIVAAALVATLEPAGAQLFRQDLTMHQTTTSSNPMGGRGGGGPQSATLYFSGNAMKHSSADGNDVIMRYDQSKMIFVDNGKKTYSEMTFDDLNKKMEQASAAMGSMTKEQRDAMRQVMGAPAGGGVKVTKQGAGETIAGYATEKYLISFPPMEMEISAAPALSIPEAYYNAMKLRMPSNPMFDMGKLYDEMKKIKGLSLKTVTSMKMMNMNMTTTTVVTSIEKGSIPASTFDIPAGYKAGPPKF